MRAVFGTLAIAIFAVAVSAQTEPAKVIAELASSSQPMKGSPFSAETVSESVQTLGDGNRIVQSSTGKIYRNGEGKVRREMTGGAGGFGFVYGNGVSIMDPFGGQNVWLDSFGRTARTMTLMPTTALKVKQLADEQRQLVEKVRAEGVKERTPLATTTVEGQRAIELKGTALARTAIAPTTVLGANGFFYQNGNAQKWETKNDDLGTQNIEGVMCEGTRRTTTIPAGAIGNERPIEITYERWYSKDLGMVVLSKHNDPRFGEQTYTLKNIVRAEPDPSLFTVPHGFKVFTEATPSGVYTTTVNARRPSPAQAPKQP